MADAITNAVVQVAVGTPLSEAYQEIKQALLSFESDVESLESTKTTIEAALLDADSLVDHTNIQRVMLEKLRCELLRLTDFLDLRAAKAMRREVMGSSWFMKEARLFFSPSNQLVARFLDARKVKDLRSKLDAIARNHAQFGSIVNVNQTQVCNASTFASRIISDIVVGRDVERDNIIRHLISGDSGETNIQVSSENLSVVSIVGVGGEGKTVLAWNIYNDNRVKGCFEVRLWVELTQNFDELEILEKILASAMKEEPHHFPKMDNFQPYHYYINRAIGGKKLLLVLDNIWDQPGLRNKWVNLERLLQVGAYGSKVLITTRNEKVAGIMDSDNPYILEDLKEEDSWFLFQKIAFTQWHEPGVEMIGQEIVKMCPNVPLVIRSIGSLLAGKRTVQEWQALRDDQLANFSSYGRDIMQTLKLSYDQLDSRLKLCVNYCTLVPKGRGFFKDEMIYRWIALDYVKPRYMNQSLEEAGEEYMIILRNSGFLREAGFLNCDLKMHDVMYDLVLSLVGSRYKVIDSNTVEFDKEIRHVYCKFNQISSFWKLPSSLLKIKHLQSFITGDHIIWKPIKTSWNNWSNQSRCHQSILKLQHLKVLDLSCLGIKELPKYVGELICLRYLNLSCNPLMKLPNSITQLVNLQSLNLYACEELLEFPKDMSKLVKLRLLKLKHCKLTHMPLGLENMTDLRTLDLFIESEHATKGVGKLGDLKMLNNLTGRLTILLKRVSKDVVSEAETTYLKMKEKLTELSFKFEYETKEDEMMLNTLQPPIGLEKLNIKGYGGEKLPYWMMDDQINTHLPHLVRIELRNCKSCRYLCSMGRLLHLQTLVLKRLDNVEYIENTTNSIDELPHTPLFPNLKDLVMHDMPKLKGWFRISSSGDKVENQNHLVTRKPSFPKLETLNVNNTALAIIVARQLSTSFDSLPRLWFPCLKASPTPEQQPLILLNSLFPNLKSLYIGCLESDVIPDEFQGLSSLETLQFFHCRQLKAIPEWIESLTSLDYLRIYDCSLLESMPQQIKDLPNLKTLDISRCPILEERCHKTTGEYWPYIQHIPHLYISH